MPADGITRADAEALFAEAVAPQVVEAVTRQSAALTTLPTIPMGSKVTRLPVLASLPTGAFLSADQEVKPQTEVSWANKTITAEEIAVIVPISETVIADASIDVVGKVTELISQEFGRVLDAAVFFGVGAPATYPTGGLHGLANTAGQKAAATGDIGQDADTVLALVENLGYDPTNVYAGRSIKSALRSQQTALGTSVYNPADAPGNTFGSLYGVPLGFPLGWDKAKADAIAVDRAGIVLGLRQDVTIKLLTEATLTGFGNLAEKDSVAVRAVMRVGFAVADPVSVDTGARKYPVGLLTPKAAVQATK